MYSVPGGNWGGGWKGEGGEGGEGGGGGGEVGEGGYSEEAAIAWLSRISNHVTAFEMQHL